jgi:hypothetical protein
VELLLPPRPELEPLEPPRPPRLELPPLLLPPPALFAMVEMLDMPEALAELPPAWPLACALGCAVTLSGVKACCSV